MNKEQKKQYIEDMASKFDTTEAIIVKLITVDNFFIF